MTEPPTRPIDPDLTLTDGIIRLRPWREEDASAMFEAVRASATGLARWLPWYTPDYALADAVDRIAVCRHDWDADEQYAFAVLDQDGEILGSVGLNQRNRGHRSANLGYWIRSSHQGQGIAARAARMVAQFGFEQLGLIRVEIVTEPDNIASRRTAEKAGARFETVARHRVWSRGRPVDAAVYALIPADLDART